MSRPPAGPGRGRGNGGRREPLQPVPEFEPGSDHASDGFPDFDELLGMPTLEIIELALNILRHPSNEPDANPTALIFKLIEALHQKLTSTDDPALLTPIEKLTKDLREASRRLGKGEARFLVDAYYKMQEDRIRSSHQVRTLAEATEGHPQEPHDVIAWLMGQEEQLEKQILTALNYYSASDVAGVWARANKGIGPVISAGLLANIEIEKAPTVGHIWRFAGLDPTSRWIGTARATELVNDVIRTTGAKPSALDDDTLALAAERCNMRLAVIHGRLTNWRTGEMERTRAALIKGVAKRPWNASLKRLCFLIGESFVKVSNRPDDVYGKIYKVRKDWETEQNRLGKYADQAKRALEEKRFDPSTDAFKHYSAGRLPPARIHLRSARRATKIFLAHLHEVLYWARYEQLPPVPWIFDKGVGHVHRIEIPNLELLPDLAEAKERASRGPRPRRP